MGLGDGQVVGEDGGLGVGGGEDEHVVSVSELDEELVWCSWVGLGLGVNCEGLS